MTNKNFVSIIGIALFSNCLFSQEQPLQISLNAIRTELKQSAIKVGVQYIQSMDSLWGKDHFKDWDKGLLTFTPEINIETGNNDAFSAITGKMTGFFMLFDTTQVSGVITPNTAKLFHTFPFSAGFETSNAFQTMNGIVEFGYVPWYQMPTTKIPNIFKATTIGVFMQAGNKFMIDNTQPVAGLGGNVDQSKEEMNKPILRAKGRVGIQKFYRNAQTGRGIGLIGTSNTWYDFLNKEIYYRVEAKMRVFLAQDKYFDFVYEKGSGAPNFNQGSQFGAGLSISF